MPPSKGIALNLGICRMMNSSHWDLLLLDRCSKEQRSVILLVLWRAWHVHNGMTHETGYTPMTESVGFLQSYR